MSYHLTKESMLLGKMPSHIRKQKINSFNQYYRSGKTIYLPRMTNTVIHGMDYIDLSAEKLFFKHRKVRPLADLEGKRKLEEPDSYLLPREPMSNRGCITPFPQQKPPIEVIAAGLREIHRQSTQCPTDRQPKSPRAFTAPKEPQDFISIHGRTLGRRAKTSTGATRHRTPKSASRSERSSAVSRPKSAVDNKLCITVDKSYVDVLKDHQRINYRIQKHYDPNVNHLDIDSLNKERYVLFHQRNLHKRECNCGGSATGNVCSSRTTAQWLSFSGMAFDVDKAGQVVDAFTNAMDPSQEFYRVEQSTGSVVAQQMSKKDRQVIIGVNGQPPPTAATDRLDFGKKTYYEDPIVPLSWNDLMGKQGVKCVDARHPVRQIKTSKQPVSGSRLVWFKKDYTEATPRPQICEKSIKEILNQQDMMNSTRHTRALERSPFTKVVGSNDTKKTASDKVKGEHDTISYDDVVELLRLHAEKNANRPGTENPELNQNNDSKMESLEPSGNPLSWDPGLCRAFCGTPQTTPRRSSPLLSPTGSGLTKPISANSFRPRKDDLHLSLRSDYQKGLLTEGDNVSKNTSNLRNGRLHTGSILHKTCAAQGASTGQQRGDSNDPESTTYIHFVNPLIRPGFKTGRDNIDHIHEVATSMVRERTVESRTEIFEPRHYPNTPVSQPFDYYASDDESENTSPIDDAKCDSVRPPSEIGISANDIDADSAVNSVSSEIHILADENDPDERETTQSHACSTVSVNIPTAK